MKKKAAMTMGGLLGSLILMTLGSGSTVRAQASTLSKNPPSTPYSMNTATTPSPLIKAGVPVTPPHAPPRKVVVGTTLFSLVPEERPYVDLDHRLREISQRLDEMAASARKNQGRGLDIAVFPENVLNPPRDGKTLMERAVALDGKVRSELGKMARKHRTYLAICFNLLEEKPAGRITNATVLFNREGEIAGIYRKVFCVTDPAGKFLEGGKYPGEDFSVFKTDFGRVGMLICYDIGYDDGFASYAADGVDLILWPSMSPQTVVPRLQARRFGFHIVSATPRDNASVFDPLGETVAQTLQEGVVTHEIDLEYRIVHWQAALREGEALREKYGKRVGFRYSSREDYGIFWSNDPAMPIGKMLEECGILTDEAHRALSLQVRERELGK
jgi:predicted amidohydrolase